MLQVALGKPSPSSSSEFNVLVGEYGGGYLQRAKGCANMYLMSIEVETPRSEMRTASNARDPNLLFLRCLHISIWAKIYDLDF